MFCLKFISGESYVCIACPHYHVSRLAGGVKEVTLYKDYTSQSGVTYRVHDSELEVSGIIHFDSCFVTADSGKTIDKI